MQKKWIIAAILIVLVAIIVWVYYYPGHAMAQLSDEVSAVDELQEWFGESPIDESALAPSNSLNFMERWQQLAEIEAYVATEPDLALQQQQEINQFEELLSEFTTQVETTEQYFDTELTSIRQNIQENRENYTHDSAEERMSELKVQLTKFVRNTNLENRRQSKNILPLRIVMDPLDYVASTGVNRKLMQMITVAIDGPSLTNPEVNSIGKRGLGGIVLLGNNVTNADQVTSLANEIQKANHVDHMFVMTDQEGGVVKRIYWDQVGAQKQLAQLNDKELCQQYIQRDKLLASLGINFNLGIVADVTSDSNSFIYSRTYGKGFERTRDLIGTALECTTQTITTLKHYPGHGATVLDTHQGLAKLEISRSRWETTHLLPFRAINDNHALMTGHLILDDIHPNTPATLSKRHINYIRAQLNHQGLIITDDLRMLEAAGLDPHQSAKRALLAGNDILLFSKNAAQVQSTLDFLTKEVREGNIEEEVIDSAVINIMTAKNQLVRQSKYKYIEL